MNECNEVNGVGGVVMRFKKWLHRHRFETTHTNRWMHPTGQRCKCGITREFKYKANRHDLVGMPWELGEWSWSDGTKSEYNVLD